MRAREGGCRKGNCFLENRADVFFYRNSAMGHYRNGLDGGACLGIEIFGRTIGILGHFGSLFMR